MAELAAVLRLAVFAVEERFAAAAVPAGFAAAVAAGAGAGSGDAAACPAGSSKVFGALTRRVPIRSGRVDGSAASTPCSSFLGLAFDFLGLSTLSAIRLRVYGSRSGRGARPPSLQAQDNRRRAVLRKFKLLDWPCRDLQLLAAGSGVRGMGGCQSQHLAPLLG